MPRNTSLGWIRFRRVVSSHSEAAPTGAIEVLTPVQMAVNPISQTGCQPDANTEQKRKTNTYEPRHPFTPRIGLGRGYLVSSPGAIRRACEGEEDDGGQNDGTLPGKDGTETENDGRHEGAGRRTHRAGRRDEQRAGGQVWRLLRRKTWPTLA